MLSATREPNEGFGSKFKDFEKLPLAGLRGDYHIEREHTCVLFTLHLH